MNIVSQGARCLAGHGDVDDADRLSLDPAMRWIVGGKAVGFFEGSIIDRRPCSPLDVPLSLLSERNRSLSSHPCRTDKRYQRSIRTTVGMRILYPVAHDTPPNGTPDNSAMSFFHVVKLLFVNLDR
ncbi:MAG: hypothetical protein E2O93_05580 [Alphaproteobacteria bacterium]|nr:MAG: hypothetical protein E2O93_05580 [Alphaproteobacteria bacterium]